MFGYLLPFSNNIYLRLKSCSCKEFVFFGTNGAATRRWHCRRETCLVSCQRDACQTWICCAQGGLTSSKTGETTHSKISNHQFGVVLWENPKMAFGCIWRWGKDSPWIWGFSHNFQTNPFHHWKSENSDFTMRINGLISTLW